jgi:ATPase involved in DNA repair (fragment)
MNDFPRGSEWRRWDLHVHTKDTNKNDQFKSKDFGTFCEVLFRKAIDNNIAAVGVTDYFSIDNYKKVKDYVSKIDDEANFTESEKKQIKNILLLPNVELRMLPATKQGRLVNIHFIFNPEENLINYLDNNFFSKLKCGNYLMNRQGIIEYGKSLLGNDQKPDDATAYKKGINKLCLEISQIKEVLKDKKIADNAVVVVCNSKTDGASAFQEHYDLFEGESGSLSGVRRDIYHISDMVFSGNDNDRRYFLGQKSDNLAKVKEKCGSLKPCIHGSDAHTEDKLFAPDNDRYCWIKADPTFDGLKQLIYEPEDRIYIGKEPPLLGRVASNKTKYIESLNIRKKDGYDNKNGVWFDEVNIELNKELVAIIGNKGNGKSALSDIIGLLGNTHNAGEKQKNLSFLTAKKFRKKGYAENFEANLVWADGFGVNETMCLADEIDKNAPEKVRYLPQNYFERLTNDLKSEGFEDTLKGVIFSHMPEQYKLGCRSFDELIEEKTRIIDSDLRAIRNDVNKISKSIIKLEEKKHPDYLNKINGQIKEKEKELKSHMVNKPEQVADPSKDHSPEAKAKISKAYESIAQLNQQNIKLAEKIEGAKQRLNTVAKNKEEIKQLIDKTSQLELDLTKFKQENGDVFSKFKLNIDEIIKVSFNKKIIDEKLKEINKELDDLERELRSKKDISTDQNIKNDADREKAYQSSFVASQEIIRQKIKSKTDELSKPEKEYQAYIEKLAQWERRKKDIEGDSSKVDSLKYLKAEKEYVEKKLDDDLAERRKARLDKSLEIFNKQQEIIDIYSVLKESVDSAISQGGEFADKFNMRIDVGFKLDEGFVDNFLGYINKNRKGTFQNADTGTVSAMVDSINLSEEDGVRQLLDSSIRWLEEDERNESDIQKRNISDQVNKVKEFYDFLFSLEYLTPSYDLKQDGKSLDQLSPGEKGAVLLVFYLMIDKEDIPLIVDQPEDNLDNKSVFEVLTHFIRIAKKRRQIIMVTHNPNLAVGADAEQIIYTSLDKTNGKNKFSVECGSIENPDINKRIVDILEGTKPAFDKRKLRYREDD